MLGKNDSRMGVGLGKMVFGCQFSVPGECEFGLGV
jgi:hypothetical protein